MSKHKSKTKWKKIKGMSRHHWINVCRGGKFTPSNISYLTIEKHQFWHMIFKNLSLEEVIELLQRVKRIKESQKSAPIPT